MHKYYIKSDSAIAKCFLAMENPQHSNDDMSSPAMKISDENTEKPSDEEVNLDDWTFFNQSDDYVSKVLKEMEE